MKRKLNIGFVSIESPESKLHWSGTPYFMIQALRRSGHTVHVLKPLPKGINFLVKVITKIKEKVRGGQHLTFMNSLLSTVSGYWFGRQDLSNYDVLLAPASSSAIAKLQTTVPIIYATDVTFRANVDYYGWFSDLNQTAFNEADEIEKNALHDATIVTLPSSWAIQSAIDHYDVNPSHLVLAEYGANLDDIPSRETAITSHNDVGRLKILFVGRGWDRKGGEIALQTWEHLRSMGYDTSITFVGSTPPRQIEQVGVNVIPLLDKNDPEQYRRLWNLYIESHFFLLPTRAEAFGIVFSEASSFGLPCISTQTGGVPNAVRNGENGYTLPIEAGAEEYAQLIASIWDDKNRYRVLVETTRNTYETILNWDVWCEKVLQHYEK